MELSKEEEELILSLIPQFYADIAFFAVYMFGIENGLRPKQLEFAFAFIANDLITFKGGVGFGKTRVMAVVILWALFVHDEIKITIFGPSDQQIQSGIWSEIRSLIGKMPEWAQAFFESTTGSQKIKRKARPDDCFVEYRLSNKESIETARGIHKKNNFIFVDEATGVPDDVYDVLKNIIVDDHAKIALISNPSKLSGYFWKTWHDPLISSMWTKVHGRMVDNPNVTPEKLAKMEALYEGKGSRQYRIMVEGEFPLEDHDGLIPRSIVLAAVNNKDFIQAANAGYVWGLDVAGASGDKGDRSVLCKRFGNEVLSLQHWRNKNAVELCELVRDEYVKTPKAQRPLFICVDGTGVGEGPAHFLRDQYGLPVRLVKVGNSPTRNPEKYSRLRDQLWWETRQWFMSENVSIPDHMDFVNDLCAPTYDDSNGKIVIESKKTLSKRLKASPDFADALCLTFAVSPSRFANAGSDRGRGDSPPDLRWAQ